MNKKNTPDRGDPVPSILSGVFLLLYDVPMAFFAVLMAGSGFLQELEPTGLCLFAPVVLAAAVLLLLRKAKAAAFLVSAAALLVLLFFLPHILDLLRGEIPEGFLPLLYALFPLGQIAAWTLLAVALFLRGKHALLLGFLSAAAALASCLADYLSYFAPGHAESRPTFMNGLPVLFAAAAVCAGLWLRSAARGNAGDGA